MVHPWVSWLDIIFAQQLSQFDLLHLQALLLADLNPSEASLDGTRAITQPVESKHCNTNKWSQAGTRRRWYSKACQDFRNCFVVSVLQARFSQAPISCGGNSFHYSKMCFLPETIPCSGSPLRHSHGFSVRILQPVEQSSSCFVIVFYFERLRFTHLWFSLRFTGSWWL